MCQVLLVCQVLLWQLPFCLAEFPLPPTPTPLQTDIGLDSLHRFVTQPLPPTMATPAFALCPYSLSALAKTNTSIHLMAFNFRASLPCCTRCPARWGSCSCLQRAVGRCNFCSSLRGGQRATGKCRQGSEPVPCASCSCCNSRVCFTRLTEVSQEHLGCEQCHHQVHSTIMCMWQRQQGTLLQNACGRFVTGAVAWLILWHVFIKGLRLIYKPICLRKSQES